MKQHIKHRLKRLFSIVDVDCVLISKMEPMNDNNFHCFTGATGSFHYATALLFPSRIHLRVAQMEVEEAKRTGYRHSVLSSDIKKDLRSVKVIGVDGNKYSLNAVADLKKLGFRVKDVSEAISAARLVKSEEEIKALRIACNIASRVADKIPNWLKVGMTERDLAARMEYEMRILGSSGVAFDTIVAFGVNSADPHHVTGSTILQKGMFVLCDFGATIENLRSDITRTFIFGKGSKQQKALYGLVLGVQMKALNTIKTHTIDDLATKAVAEINKGVAELGLKGGMIHSLGHGLGWDVHEDSIVNMKRAKFIAFQVTTIEPGAYVPGFGGVRIEDDVLITAEGIEVLTTAKK